MRTGLCVLACLALAPTGLACRPTSDASASAVRRPTADRVLSPTVRGVVAQDSGSVRRLEGRLAVRGRRPLSDLVHAMHLHGPGARVEGSAGAGPTPVIDLLLDADRGEAFFGSRHLCPTRYGARFPVASGHQVGTEQGGAESHRGQTLAVLGAAGVGLDRPIRLPGGGAATLRAVFDDLVANFSLGGEIYWEAVCLGLYVPPARDWRNKFGQTFTFDDLARELLRRPVGESACGGVHRLSSLAVLVRVDRDSRVLSPGARGEVNDHLREVAGVLTRSQRADGSWPLDWHLDLKGGRPAGAKRQDDPWSKIIATGHHLEWLMILPDDLRPPPAVFAKGAAWLLPALLRELGDRDDPWAYYCPASHAVRAVRILSRAGGGGTG